MQKSGFLCTVLCAAAVLPTMGSAANSPGGSNQASAQGGAPVEYSVVYTGRLFGYFRYPEVQTYWADRTLDKQSCPVDLPGDEAAQAAEAFAFLKFRASHNPDSPLVAMGDNLAPFLLARRVWAKDPRDPNPKPKQDEFMLVPKESFDFSGLGYDNVACFLRLAHFAAVVPGEHDFYFGPQYLRDVADALNADKVDMACPPQSGLGNCDYQPVRMLGLNLSLKVQRTDGQQQDGGSSGGAPSPAGPHVVIPKVVLPWIRSIPVSDTTGLSNPCLSTQAKPVTCTGQIPLTIVADAGTFPAGSPIPGRLNLQLDEKTFLAPGKYHLLATCDGKEIELSSFTVREPLFLGGKRAKPHPAAGQDANEPGIGVPWKLVNLGDKKVVFFGVVDPNLGQLVGRLNYTWLGLKPNSQDTDNSYETVVDFSDPIEALNQALQLCGQTDSCNTARKVLLAQMSEAAVNQNILPFLKTPAGTQRFDLVIAQSDPDAGTGNKTATVSPVAGDPNPLERPAVLVPGSNFKSPDSQPGKAPTSPYLLAIRLATATVTDDDTQRTRTVSNQVDVSKEAIQSSPFNHFQGWLKALQGTKTLKDTIAACQALARNTPFDSKNPSPLRTPATPEDQVDKEKWQAGLEEVSLRVTREACNSDIAMLQHRDVFYAPELAYPGFTDAGVSAAIGAIFWKGDLIQCVNIPGQTISSLLQRSADIQHAQDAGQSTDLSRGWPLVVTGIMQAESNGKTGGANPQWLVHGDALDAKKLYSVAVTDYLANGDTGYPDLKNAEPTPKIVLGRLKFWNLADHLVAELNQKEDAPQLGENLLDGVDNTPLVPPKAKQDTFLEWAASWAKFDQFPKTDAPNRDKNKTRFDIDGQQEPTFFLRLYKADFGYSLFQHNLNEGAIPQEFPGVTSPDLSAADSENYTADWQARLQRTGRLWEPYIETDGNWGRRNQRSKASPFAYQPSQTANAYDVEMGEALHVYPSHQNPSGLRLILPASMKSQIAPPYTQIVPFNGKSSGVPVTAPRNYYLSFRPGLRLEHNFPKKSDSAGGGGQGSQNQGPVLNSYIESGFQFGEALHSPSAFLFSNPGTSALPGCAAGLVLVANLVECVGPQGLGSGALLKTVFANRDFYQQGVYLNFRFDAPLPLPSSGEYIVENRGDLFMNRVSDTAVDIRLLDDVKQSLVFPIYGKLSVGPSLEFIFFKTKVTGNYYFSYATAVSVSYNFDWHPGVSWRKALGFGTPATAPKSLPTK